MATPISAFCCCITRSAAAMSGRRSSSWRHADGERRIGPVSGIGGRFTSLGGLPISMAIACCNCAIVS